MTAHASCANSEGFSLDTSTKLKIACLLILQDEYGAALAERERGYCELLDELRSLRRRCPSPKLERRVTDPRAIMDCPAPAHTAPDMNPDKQLPGQLPSGSRLHSILDCSAPYGNPDKQLLGQLPSGSRLHSIMDCPASDRNPDKQLQGQLPPGSRPHYANGHMPVPAGQKVSQQVADACTPAQRQPGSAQQQGGFTGRQTAHPKPSRIPTVRQRLIQLSRWAFK